MEDSFSTRSCLLEQEIKGQRLWHTSYLVIYRVVGETLACVYPVQNVYTSAGIVENSIADGTIALASMWISIAMKKERLAIISDDITKMDGFFKSPDDITKIVGQSCVPCKPLCCSPTLLTLPLKIRVPPANATHLYIIILQLLNILITSYGKYQILPNPHNTAQFKPCMPCYSTVQLCMPC